MRIDKQHLRGTRIPMKFSWKALILAPLIVPVLVGGLAAVDTFGAKDPLFAFVLFFVPGIVVAYGATVCLFLPCLYVLSQFTRPTFLSTCLLGLLLGAACYLPLLWMAWVSSGPDSGPPEQGFIAFAIRFSADPILLIFPAAGLVTAAAYWLLGSKRQLAAPPDDPRTRSANPDRT